MNIAKTMFATLLLGVCALALARKETLYNEHYIGPDENQAWEENAVPIPAYPAGNEQWANLYISQTYTGQPKLMLNSIHINTDHTIHYILNQQSKQGINNLSAEAIHCPTRRMKVFGFGDDVNKRWIQPRNSQWKVIGTTLNELDRVRSVLYQTFCEDGLPRNQQELMQRITTRAMR
ncbi:CNP1-like family protein [Snodgrassella gandavensis]|uniref:CNP1-like family protein n=1 Tax=Snodgrassella gandavensis TaxID=2946698 RepID=UPI001EF624BD|nr:CNP1-like family protein [Snodgrassella gandavensis]